MNTKQLKYTLTLAHEGSFSRAAELLGISQPSLSQYIRKIEEELDTELFSRIGGDVRLTDAGRAYVEAGRKILDIERRMEAEISDLCASKTGTLVIGTSPFRSASMMPSIAYTFKKRYPGVCLVIDEMESSALADALSHGEVDLCVTPMPVNEKLFSYEKIFDEELILAVPSERAKSFQAEAVDGRKYPAIDVTALNGEPFVMITDAQIMARALYELCEDYGITAEPAVRVKSLEAQIAMVKAGLGLALVPTGVMGFDDACDGIAYFSLKEALPHREVVAVYRKDVPLTRILRDFIDTMKASQKSNCKQKITNKIYK